MDHMGQLVQPSEDNNYHNNKNDSQKYHKDGDQTSYIVPRNTWPGGRCR